MALNYILVRRDENTWVKYETSQIERFNKGEFGYIATIRDGEQIIERCLSKYEVEQIWDSLSLRQRTQLHRAGLGSKLIRWVLS